MRPQAPRHRCRSSARARSCAIFATCALWALGLASCGRLGFDPLARDDDGPATPRDGGRTPVGGSGGAPAANDAGPTPSAEAGTPGTMDASADGSTDASMDAARDAGTTPTPDAVVDATIEPDAAIDAGIDSGMPDAGPPCAEPSATSFCAALPGLPTAPLIDGVLECGLTLQPVPVLHWTSTTSPVPAGHSARMAWAWRPDGVYVFVDVDDATRLPALVAEDPYFGDSVEVYVDADGAYPASPVYDNPGATQLIAVAPADGTTSVTRGQRWRTAVRVGDWLGTQYASFPKPGGYVLEAFVNAADLDLASWSLAAGQRVGIDLSINLSVSMDPPVAPEMANVGRRLGQYFMSVPDPCAAATCLPFQSVVGFCSPLLE